MKKHAGYSIHQLTVSRIQKNGTEVMTFLLEISFQLLEIFAGTLKMVNRGLISGQYVSRNMEIYLYTLSFVKFSSLRVHRCACLPFLSFQDKVHFVASTE